MATYEHTTEINAPTETVAGLLHGMKDWPRWTRTVHESTPLGSGEVVPGARVRVRQPLLPTSVWTVDQVDPSTFEWNNFRHGLRTVATHTFADIPTGCRLTVTIRQDGLLAPLVSLVYGRVVRRFLSEMSADLTVAAEAGSGEHQQPVAAPAETETQRLT